MSAVATALTARQTLSIVVPGFAFACALAIVIIAPQAEILRLVLGVTGVLLLPTVLLYRRRMGWLHPLSLPAIYVAVALLAPVTFVVATGQTLGRLGGASGVTIAALGATFVGYWIGAWFSTTRSRACRRAHERSQPRKRSVSYPSVSRAGRAGLVLVVVLAASQVLLRTGLAYGERQTVYGISSLIAATLSVLVVTSVALLIIGNTGRLHERILTPRDSVLIILALGMSLATGSRSEFLACILLLSWARLSIAKPPSTVIILGVFIILVTVLQSVSLERGDSTAGNSRSVVERVLGDLASPAYITETVVANVPERHDYESGSTYIASLYRQLPGPMSRVMFGPPDDTGSYIYRDIAGIDNPNIGVAFAMPAEAYLNYGLPGTLVVGFVFGAVYGWAFVARRIPAYRARHVAYGLLVASMPFILRSDALGSIKRVAMPLLLIAIALSVYQRRKAGTKISSELSLVKPET